MADENEPDLLDLAKQAVTPTTSGAEGYPDIPHAKPTPKRGKRSKLKEGVIAKVDLGELPGDVGDISIMPKPEQPKPKTKTRSKTKKILLPTWEQGEAEQRDDAEHGRSDKSNTARVANWSEVLPANLKRLPERLNLEGDTEMALWQKAKRMHCYVQAAMVSALMYARECGLVLQKLRLVCESDWLGKLAAAGISPSTYSLYLLVVNNWDKLESVELPLRQVRGYLKDPQKHAKKKEKGKKDKGKKRTVVDFFESRLDAALEKPALYKRLLSKLKELVELIEDLGAPQQPAD